MMLNSVAAVAALSHRASQCIPGAPGPSGPRPLC
jgi:hypothetical protein